MDIDLESVQNFFRWAEIEKSGEIEAYQLKWRKDTPLDYPVSQYQRVNRIETNSVMHLIEIVQQWKDSLITVGVNPRPKGLIGTAKDQHIQIYKNLYLDIEPIHAPNTNVTREALERCKDFVSYVLSHQILIQSEVVIAESGNGFHLCIAIPPYNNPQEFGNKLQTWYKTQLLHGSSQQRSYHNCRIDSTFSPSRQVKLYGTRKPIEGARLSSFPNVQRIESADFRDYILSFPEKPRKQVTVDFDGGHSARTLADIEQKYRLRD